MTDTQPSKTVFDGTGLLKKRNIVSEIRQAIKEMKPCLRRMSVFLVSIFNEDGMKMIPERCQNARLQLVKIRECYSRLTTIVPENEYHRFRNLWRYQTVRAAHLVLLIVFLETGTLCSRKEFAKTIGVHDDQMERFPINNEEYLNGLINMVSDLVRYAVTCVTYRDYETPVQVANFVIKVSKSLNLLRQKKEGLRKRIRSLKFDVKNLEELLYDLSLRNHLKPKHLGAEMMKNQD
ncbi:hypothetical protein LSTR_LSTR005610 [Laodelphax striatellus]|uniref:Translin n=1 Tax=Laodelphax striatellus TaxID=195883 RepID=A0A482WUX9_LAOST|nr:hypothetical protein LSTR_LSTR005610 [Laodelphax striatellus]